MKYTNSHILEPRPGPLPIVINENLLAIPMSGSTTQLMVIHNGSPVKVCRNRQSALTLIKKLKKQLK
mgnify:CR=1 FL=1|jgi:hypothetical protein